MKAISQNILIIGAGKVGTSLYRVLKKIYPDRQIMLQGRSFQQNYNLNIKDYITALNVRVLNKSKLIFITVPDDSISDVALNLSSFPVASKYIFHTSVAKSNDELKSLKKNGAFTAALHPLQSFQNYSDPEKWQDIIFSFQGDKETLNLAKKIVKDLKAHILELSPKQKLALHVAAVFSANYLVALLQIAENIIEENGINTVPANKLLYPLVKGVLENYKEYKSSEILTGPLKRGDINTIQTHLQFISDNKLYSQVYRDMIHVILKNPAIKIDNVQEIKKIIGKV